MLQILPVELAVLAGFVHQVVRRLHVNVKDALVSLLATYLLLTQSHLLRETARV